jgi:hypothetical protein
MRPYLVDVIVNEQARQYLVLAETSRAAGSYLRLYLIGRGELAARFQPHLALRGKERVRRIR